MFKPVEMQKIRIVALNSVAKRLVAELHELGMVEVTKVPESDLETNTPFSDYSEISSRLVQLRSIKNIFGKYSKKDSKKRISEKKLDTLEEELKSLVKESSDLQNQIRRINDELKILNQLKTFELDFSSLTTSVTDYTLGMIPRDNFARCMTALEKYKKDFKLTYKLTKNEAILLFIHRDDLVLDGLLNKFGFVKISTPKEMQLPKSYIKKQLSEVGRINVRIATINARLNELAENYYTSISLLLDRYNTAVERSKIAAKFGFSEKMMVLEGWMEKNKFVDLLKNLEKNFKNKASLFTISSLKDKPPIKLENPSVMGPVEFFVDLFSLPNHRELDPTFLFFFTAPLFYGLIMGDVIYGLFSIIVAVLLLKKIKPDPKGILFFTIKLWIISAIPAIFFGVIFDEWMAMPHYEFFNYLGEYGLPIAISEPMYHGFSRIHNLTALIGISALIGVLNLALGFFLGAINEWGHNKKHAIAKLSWIGVDIGGAVAVMSYMFNMFPQETIGLYSVVVLVISALLVIITEGVVGALEIPGLAGNILSYTRIAAVGVVGVILAEIINEFFLPDPGNMLMLVVMVPLILIMHGVNTLIVMVEALIQGGRLNIVEFQQKFMQGGGKRFRPFMLNSK